MVAFFCARVRHDAKRLDGRFNCLAKAKQVVTSRVQVPMEALMTGTSSRTARVSRATANLTEAAGKLLARGTRIGYEATTWWVRGRKDSKPDVIGTRLSYIRRVCERKVTRLTLRDLAGCLMRILPSSERLRKELFAESEVSRGHSKSTLNSVTSARCKSSRVDQGPNCLIAGCRAFDVR
jgi:hypothetical protein